MTGFKDPFNRRFMKWHTENSGLRDFIKELGKQRQEYSRALADGEMGIFCCADHFMVPLRQELATAGLSPARVKHLSCDNNPYYLKGVYPQAAEIEIGMYEIGATAARQILKGSAEEYGKVAIPPRLLPAEEMQ